MAEFHSHLESYDSQLDEVKKLAGDATFLVTKIDERVQVFERNLTGLKGGLEGLRQQHKEADDNLDLLTFVSPTFFVTCTLLIIISLG